MIKTGDRAPDFELPDADMQMLRSADLVGQHYVLYFYPKDDTPGCTTEALEFSALIKEFDAADTVVLGVSKDTCARHQKFIAKHELKVELLADTEGELCELYGTWGLKKFMGREFMGVLRTTFIIGKDGRLKHVMDKVKTKSHHDDVIDLIKELGL